MILLNLLLCFASYLRNVIGTLDLQPSSPFLALRGPHILLMGGRSCIMPTSTTSLVSIFGTTLPPTSIQSTSLRVYWRLMEPPSTILESFHTTIFLFGFLNHSIARRISYSFIGFLRWLSCYLQQFWLLFSHFTFIAPPASPGSPLHLSLLLSTR